MRKKIFSIILIVAMVGVLLISCSGSSASSGEEGQSSSRATKDAMDRVFESGKLVVATELGTPPFAYRDSETGEIDGLAIELARMFADELGVELEIRTYEWAGIIPSLLTDKVDMLATCLTRTTARAGRMIFVEPFVSNPAMALTKSGTLKSLDEINQPGIVITTTTGSIWEEVAETMFPKATIRTNATNADNAVALQTGRADVYLNDKLQLMASINMYPGEFELIDEPFDFDSLAFAVRFDSPKLGNAANMFMRLKRMTGEYQEVYKKWMGYDYDPTFEVGS